MDWGAYPDRRRSRRRIHRATSYPGEHRIERSDHDAYLVYSVFRSLAAGWRWCRRLRQRRLGIRHQRMVALRRDDLRELEYCEAPKKKRAEPDARANGPERPWLILNVGQKNDHSFAK